MNLSACIITLNEEENIVRCLKSLDFVQDIVIVDSGSKDRTRELAVEYGARVYRRDFDNYVNQKNYAVSLAENDWVLAIDADEEISPQLKEEILSIDPKSLSGLGGFITPRLTYYLGKWIRHGGWYPNLQIRFFDRRFGEFHGDLVHETVKSSLPFRKLKNPIYHYSYTSISDHIEYMNKYSTLSAIQKYKKGKRSGVAKAVIKFSYKFIWTYFFRMGFLDGSIGFIVCFLSSYYNFLKYTKLYELQLKEKLSSSLPVVIDPIHNVESEESAQKNGNQIHMR